MRARVHHPSPWSLPSRSRPGIGLWPTARPAATQTTVDKSALAKGERILATGESDHIVATDLALYHGSEAGWNRLGWEHIERADWDDDHHRLLLIGQTPDVHTVALHLPASSPLVALARERIGWTTLLITRVTLADLGEAMVTVRRDPRDGPLLWVVRPHPSVDTADPRLESRIDEAIRWLRAQMGLAAS